jgi:hypothetical protein
VVGVRLIDTQRKKVSLLRITTKSLALAWSEFFDKQPKLKKTNMRFGTWKVRSLNGASSLMTVARELSKA